MDMRSAVPDWLTPVAWTYIALSLLSVAVIAADIYLARRRHPSVATELVWISSALYLGPFAIPIYLNRGRAGNASSNSADGVGRTTNESAVAVLPGGGASAVAHLIAVPFVVAVGWTIAGLAMWPMILVIALLVVVMLAVYERIDSRRAHSGHIRGLSIGAALVTAVITVVAFDVGMVGWMLLLHFNNAMPAVTESTFWFLMQLGVIAGLVTGYPAVAWLLRRNQTVVPV
ncbi:membrane protein [Nocardioides phosphati]|uniref:Membrane protein n=1 Tax=Nocardioides phosphati TaxID=1867775 RepID=A0ABQ2N8B2_9ACTN|nr:DUF4396 domain-containing protein [Nocardioides phosphati]GGO85433.1 membrane protein [Nocardioides phosphati]